MNRMRKKRAVFCISLMAVALLSLSGAALSSNQGVSSLCSSCSAIPEEEACVSIGGCFFSCFDGRVGRIFSDDGSALPRESAAAYRYIQEHDSLGSLVLQLDQMHHESPYVYTTDGKVSVSIDGSEHVLSMEKLDYVYDSAEDRLYYRLTCSPESGCDSSVEQAYVLCYPCGGTSPILSGSLTYLSGSGGVQNSYPFTIAGRDPFGAERHLEKRIERVMM